MKLEFFKDSKDTFLLKLDEQGINYNINHPKPNVIYASGESAEIILALGEASVFVSLAAVVVQWLKARASRKVFIQTKDKQVINLEVEGYSKKDVANILSNAEKLTVIDIKPNKSFQPTAAASAEFKR